MRIRMLIAQIACKVFSRRTLPSKVRFSRWMQRYHRQSPLTKLQWGPSHLLLQQESLNSLSYGSSLRQLLYRLTPELKHSHRTKRLRKELLYLCQNQRSPNALKYLNPTTSCTSTRKLAVTKSKPRVKWCHQLMRCAGFCIKDPSSA